MNVTVYVPNEWREWIRDQDDLNLSRLFQKALERERRKREREAEREAMGAVR
jgi:post-segregation antitoxin (ccd killing protein)